MLNTHNFSVYNDYTNLYLSREDCKRLIKSITSIITLATVDTTSPHDIYINWMSRHKKSIDDMLDDKLSKIIHTVPSHFTRATSDAVYVIDISVDLVSIRLKTTLIVYDFNTRKKWISIDSGYTYEQIEISCVYEALINVLLIGIKSGGKYDMDRFKTWRNDNRIPRLTRTQLCDIDIISQ